MIYFPVCLSHWSHTIFVTSKYKLLDITMVELFCCFYPMGLYSIDMNLECFFIRKVLVGTLTCMNCSMSSSTLNLERNSWRLIITINLERNTLSTRLTWMCFHKHTRFLGIWRWQGNLLTFTCPSEEECARRLLEVVLHILLQQPPTRTYSVYDTWWSMHPQAVQRLFGASFGISSIIFPANRALARSG